MSSASHSASSSCRLAQKRELGPLSSGQGRVDAICRSRSDRAKRPRNESVFSFPNLTKDIKQQIVSALLSRLKEGSSCSLSVLCLRAFCILSRDKTDLEILTSEFTLDHLIRQAGLADYTAGCEDVAGLQGEEEVMVEAQKCLCNLIYNSTAAQSFCSQASCVEAILQRVKTYKNADIRFDIKVFDLKMLFLLTAFPSCIDNRPRVRYQLHGFQYLLELLDVTLRSCQGQPRHIAKQEAELCVEILKILFNITVALEKKSADEGEDARFRHLVSVLRGLLLCDDATELELGEIKRNAVNLLINIPRQFYEELVMPTRGDGFCETQHEDGDFAGKNMDAICSLLDYLQYHLDTPTTAVKEWLCPIMHCMVEICRHNGTIRKFCRLKVLPPLTKEVLSLPEEGTSLRNKLCKLLTDSVTEVKDLAAHFLFILCKENVGRMMKYTGYGNCAGLLAQLGLLKLKDAYKKGDYSSDSEDSDTEEYTALKEQVNPVTGRWEEEKPSATEGMTGEQREYEAEQLLNIIDRLDRQGIIHPCRVGEDGRPEPVGHVMELLEQGWDGARPSTINHSGAIHSPTNRNDARHSPTNHDGARHSPTNHDGARPSPTNHDGARPSPTNHDGARPSTTNHDGARPSTTNHDDARLSSRG